MSNPDSEVPAGVPAPQRAAAQLEMASVLFMDIVSYSLEPMERQSSMLADLQHIVRETTEFQRAYQCNQIISLPTGDGIALVFFDTPLVPVECALQVARSLRSHPELKLRMGVHTGPVYRINDINANMNVAGGGINMAQRVMDAGDGGHLLISSAVAEVLKHLSGWPQYLKDLGEHCVKHGVKMHLYAICTDDVANHEIPQKLRKTTAAPEPAVAVGPAPAVSQAQPVRGLYMAIGSMVTILVLAVALIKGPALFDSGRAASLAKPVRTPVTFEAEAQQDRKSQPSTPTEARREPKSTALARPQLQIEQDRTEARSVRIEPQTTAQVRSAEVMPAHVPQVAPAAPQTPPPDPDRQQELRSAAELLTNLRARGSAVQSSLATMKQQQARMGLNLRGDIVSAEQRMQFYLSEAQNAVVAGDAEKAKTGVQNAERALETIEKFLGR